MSCARYAHYKKVRRVLARRGGARRARRTWGVEARVGRWIDYPKGDGKGDGKVC